MMVTGKHVHFVKVTCIQYTKKGIKLVTQTMHGRIANMFVLSVDILQDSYNDEKL